MKTKMKIDFDVSQYLVDVCIPSYYGSEILDSAINTVLTQSHQNFRILISDNTPETDVLEREKIARMIESFNDSRIHYRANSVNLGYPRNIMSLYEWSSAEYVFLLAQDDLLSEIAIEAGLRGLIENSEIAAIARPYYWFFDDPNKAVREIQVLDSSRMVVVNCKSSESEIIHTLISASQLSGLMYRRSRIHEPFVNSIFPAHIYPLAGALRDYGVGFMPFHTVAVCIGKSQTRHISEIYSESPTDAWVDLYKHVFRTEQSLPVATMGIKNHMGRNYVGLIQIRNFGKFRYFLRELFILLRIRPKNLVSLKFWFYAIGLTVLPPRLCIWAVDNFKDKILSRKLEGVSLAKQKDAWW
jgi:glycosyltransferase involved in cell wall biosynthesis